MQFLMKLPRLPRLPSLGDYLVMDIFVGSLLLFMLLLLLLGLVVMLLEGAACLWPVTLRLGGAQF